MNKFKVGDKVKVRSDLEIGKYYGGMIFLDGMKYLKGKEVTIEGITSQGNYVFEESYFYYSKEIIILVKSLVTVKLEPSSFNKCSIVVAIFEIG